MDLQRITHDVQQGTGPWLRLREGFFTASEAPAALGVSKYVTRAQLLRRKHTGVADEPDASTLAKFRAGHDAEALARPLAEGIAEGDLYPVTMSVQVAGLPLLASLDGLTLDGETAWETKLWNEDLAAHVRAGTLPEHYTVQMDQELLVSGAKRCLFTCTDGTPERLVSCWYETSDERIETLLSGWLQFKADVKAALEALSNIGVNDVSVTGGPGGTGAVFTVTFRNALAATNVAQLTSASSLTGTSPGISHATTVGGVAAAQTINLLANSALEWLQDAGYFSNPLTTNWTSLLISNDSGAPATFDCRVLYN
jgi:putative phage-type endonuclease